MAFKLTLPNTKAAFAHNSFTSDTAGVSEAKNILQGMAPRHKHREIVFCSKDTKIR